jgi:hypothetical protein
MSAAAVDRLLAALVAALDATGLLTLRAGTPPSGWLFVLHGLLGGALLVALAVKLGRSVPRALNGRRWGRLLLGLLLAGGALVAVLGGFAWAAAGSPIGLGPWTLITLHAAVGLALLPVLAVHLWPRRWALLRPGPGTRGAVARLISRRTFLAGGGRAMETSWSGVPLSRLLELAGPTPGAARVEIRSVTGWGAVLPLEEARRAFLATGVAGGPLPLANGAPCRLVAPERRGLDWVKWVEAIEVG